MSSTPHLKIVSDQAGDIYKLLLKSGPMTAQEVAGKLDILPNGVYRAVKKLISVGMVEKVEAYPIKFKANNVNLAMNWYLLAAAQNFKQDFKAKDKSSDKTANVPSISFVKDRTNLIARELEDLRRAQKTYNSPK